MSQIKIEKNISAIMNISEDKEITLTISSPDFYFLKNNESINFMLNDKVYIIHDLKFFPLPNNQFSIKINNKNLEMILQANSIFKININLGFQKLFELLL